MTTRSERRKIEREIVAYEAMRKNLERDHNGKWVVFYGQELIGLFDDFVQASREAARRFGRGPYLVRRIGAGPLVLPASVAYQHDHGSR